MGDQAFFTIFCTSCKGGIEFPAQGIGLEVECPHCRQTVMLSFPTGPDCDPVEQIDAFLSASSFPKSETELRLLSAFSFPSERDPVLEQFKSARGMGGDPDDVIDRFLSEGFLQDGGADVVVLLQGMSLAELKDHAKARGLALSGNKETVAKRLVRADPDGMRAMFRGRHYLVCSRKGQMLALRFYEAKRKKQEQAENKCLAALRDGRLKDACLAGGEMGILQSIFSVLLPRHAQLDANTVQNLRVGAAMAHIWGCDTSRWLPKNLDEHEVNLAAEARMLLFHVLERIRLGVMKQAGITRVKVVGSGHPTDCRVCRSASGTKHPIQEAPILPHEGCTCEMGCRCMLCALED